MVIHSRSDNPQEIKFVIEIIPEDPLNPDLTLVDAVGRITIDLLHNEGFTIRFPYTGQRGGFLVEVITFITTITEDILTYKDVLGEASSLISILGAVISVTKHVRKAHEQRIGKDNIPQQTIKITLDVDGTSIPIEVPDLEKAEGILKIAQRIQERHPDIATKVKSQSKIKIKYNIPKKPSRRKR